MRLGKRNVTHFVLFDKWGKPLYNLTICSSQISLLEVVQPWGYSGARLYHP